MLSVIATQNNHGILLSGDYLSMKSLHSVIQDANAVSLVTEKDREGFVFRFAQEVSAAQCGNRLILQPPLLAEEIGVRFGVNFSWIEILILLRVMRKTIGQGKMPRVDSAIINFLEALVEDCLKLTFEQTAKKILDKWIEIQIFGDNLESTLTSRVFYFDSLPASEREHALPFILASFEPQYESVYHYLILSSQQYIHPDVFKKILVENPSSGNHDHPIE